MKNIVCLFFRFWKQIPIQTPKNLFGYFNKNQDLWTTAVHIRIVSSCIFSLVCTFSKKNLTFRAGADGPGLQPATPRDQGIGCGEQWRHALWLGVFDPRQPRSWHWLQPPQWLLHVQSSKGCFCSHDHSRQNTQETQVSGLV